MYYITGCEVFTEAAVKENKYSEIKAKYNLYNKGEFF